VKKGSDQLSKTLSKDEVIEIIVKTTGLDRSEIIQKINETITMMDQMVNEEGAAYIVADKLNVSLEANKTSTTLKIDQLLAGQSNVTVIGRISKIYPTKTFTRKDNTIGKVRNLELIDNTGSIRVSLWDGKVDSFIQKNISIGDILGISGGNVKTGYKDALEISVGAHGLLENTISGIKESDYPDIPQAEKISLNSLIDATGEVSIEGKIIDKQPTYEFDRDGRKGKVASLTVKDDTGQTRVTFWNDDCDKYLNFEIGDEISVSSLRVTTNKYGDKELTFNSYSIINKITDTGKFDTVIVADPDKSISIKDINDGMNNITVVGKVIEKYDLKEFEKEGRANKVQSIIIQDNTGSMRVTFWGDKTSDISAITPDTIIKISYCRSRLNNYSNEIEITATDKSTIELNPVEGKSIEDSSSLKLTFSEISSIRRGVSIVLKVNRVFEVRTVNIKETDAKVLNLSVVDTEGNQGKIAAWDDNISKISDLNEDDSI
jgi:replication factor A1